jgi:hypothetical protein
MFCTHLEELLERLDARIVVDADHVDIEHLAQNTFSDDRTSRMRASSSLATACRLREDVGSYLRGCRWSSM